MLFEIFLKFECFLSDGTFPGASFRVHSHVEVPLAHRLKHFGAVFGETSDSLRGQVDVSLVILKLVLVSKLLFASFLIALKSLFHLMTDMVPEQT